MSTVLFWVAGFVILMTLSIGLAAYVGVRSGERDREQERLTLADQHYRKGLERLDAGEYELAIAEFEYVLKFDPQHSFAPQGIAEAKARLEQLNTLPTPTAIVQDDVAARLFERSSTLYEAERWQEAAALLTQLRAVDLQYRKVEVEQMLFSSLYDAGIALLGEDRLEEGIFYLDQAVALRPLDEETLAQRSLAVQYMTALDYWGADWETCIWQFEQLYATAPAYKDVARRLYQAHLLYADGWSAQGEMCPAEEQYAAALRLFTDPQVEDKRSQAQQVCLVATPTPIPPITGTLAFTLTAAPPGFTTGKLAYPIYNSGSGAYEVYALYADGRVVRMAAGADQPFWLWGGGALAYRDLVAPGLSLLVPGGAPRLVAPGAGLALPSFSPDGGRMAYAAQNAGGTWQIVIAPTDGSSEARAYADGKGPVWGPNGLLAWTGCDSSGACGIFVDNPDDDQPPIRLTASVNDIGLSWASYGGVLAYMSDVSGNWEIYTVNLSAGVAVLTADPASDGLPAWAPDGTHLAFVSNRDGAWGIYLMGPNGEDPHKILALGPSMPNWTTQRLSWAP